MVVVEDARRCTKCAYGWFAKRVHKPAKTYGAGAGWELLGSTGMAAGAGAKAGAHYATKLERHERWRQCPRCGSRKVRTEPKRGFVPTAAENAQEEVPQPSAPKAAAKLPAPRGRTRSAAEDLRAELPQRPAPRPAGHLPAPRDGLQTPNEPVPAGHIDPLRQDTDSSTLADQLDAVEKALAVLTDTDDRRERLLAKRDRLIERVLDDSV